MLRGDETDIDDALCRWKLFFAMVPVVDDDEDVHCVPDDAILHIL